MTEQTPLHIHLRDQLFQAIHLVPSDSQNKDILSQWETYIKGIAQKLYKNTPEFKDFKWENLQIKLVDEDEVNAFFMDGSKFNDSFSYLALSRGLLARLENEDELAGVIGHEMGHALLLKFSQNNLQNQKNNKVQEGLADSFAVRHMLSADYDPRALIDFFKKNFYTSEDIIQKLGKIIDEHPKNETRISLLETLTMKYAIDLPKNSTYKKIAPIIQKTVEAVHTESETKKLCHRKIFQQANPVQKVEMLLEKADSLFHELYCKNIYSNELHPFITINFFIQALTHPEASFEKQENLAPHVYLNPQEQIDLADAFKNIFTHASSSTKKQIFKLIYEKTKENYPEGYTNSFTPRDPFNTNNEKEPSVSIPYQNRKHFYLQLTAYALHFLDYRPPQGLLKDYDELYSAMNEVIAAHTSSNTFQKIKSAFIKGNTPLEKENKKRQEKVLIQLEQAAQKISPFFISNTYSFLFGREEGIRYTENLLSSSWLEASLFRLFDSKPIQVGKPHPYFELIELARQEIDEKGYEKALLSKALMSMGIIPFCATDSRSFFTKKLTENNKLNDDKLPNTASLLVRYYNKNKEIYDEALKDYQGGLYMHKGKMHFYTYDSKGIITNLQEIPATRSSLDVPPEFKILHPYLEFAQKETIQMKNRLLPKILNKSVQEILALSDEEVLANPKEVIEKIAVLYQCSCAKSKDIMIREPFNELDNAIFLSELKKNSPEEIAALINPAIHQQLYLKYMHFLELSKTHPELLELLQQRKGIFPEGISWNNSINLFEENPTVFIKFIHNSPWEDIFKKYILENASIFQKHQKIIRQLFHYEKPQNEEQLKHVCELLIKSNNKKKSNPLLQEELTLYLADENTGAEIPIDILIKNNLFSIWFDKYTEIVEQKLKLNIQNIHNWPDTIEDRFKTLLDLSQTEFIKYRLKRKEKNGLNHVPLDFKMSKNEEPEEELEEETFPLFTFIPEITAQIQEDFLKIPSMEQKVRILISALKENKILSQDKISQLRENFLNDLLQNPLFWEGSLSEQISFYTYAVYEKIFHPNLKTQRAVLSNLLKKIEKVTPVEQEKYYLQLLAKRNEIDFPDLKDQAVQGWAKAVKEIIGKEDDSSKEYMDLVQPFINHLQTKESGLTDDLFEKKFNKSIHYTQLSTDTYAALTTELQKQLVSQEELSQKLEPRFGFDLTNSSSNQKMGMHLDSLITLIREKSETADAIIDLLLEPNNMKNALLFKKRLKKIIGYQEPLLQKMIEEFSPSVVMLQHDQFWHSSLTTRALIMKELLRGSAQKITKRHSYNDSSEIFLYFHKPKNNFKSKEEIQEIEKIQTSYIFNLVSQKLIPDDGTVKNRELLVTGLKNYINSHQDYEMHFLLAAFLASRRKTQENDNSFNLGKSTRLFMENRGPAEIKLGQFLSARGDLPADFIAEMKTLTNQAAIPPRSEIYHILQTYHPEVLEQLKKQKKRLGKIMAAGSHFIAIDLGDEVLSLGKEHSQLQAKQGFERMIHTFQELLPHTTGTERDTIQILMDSAQQAYSMNEVETNANLGYQQFLLSQQLYDSTTMNIDGSYIHFKTMPWTSYSTKLVKEGKNTWTQSYKLMEKARGVDFTNMPNTTPEEQLLKTTVAKANFMLNLGTILKGGVFDDDRHSGQLKVLTHPKMPGHIYVSLFDTGSTSLTEPTQADRILFGQLIYHTFKQTISTGNLLDNTSFMKGFNESMSLIRQHYQGETPLYIAKVQRALSALSHFSNDIPTDQMGQVIITVLRDTPIHPDILTGIYQNASDFEKLLLNTLMPKGSLLIDRNAQKQKSDITDTLKNLMTCAPLTPQLLETNKQFDNQPLVLTTEEQEQTGVFLYKIFNYIKNSSEFSVKQINLFIQNAPTPKIGAYLQETCTGVIRGMSANLLHLSDSFTQIASTLSTVEINPSLLKGMRSQMSFMEKLAFNFILNKNKIKEDAIQTLLKNKKIKKISQKIQNFSRKYLISDDFIVHADSLPPEKSNDVVSNITQIDICSANNLTQSVKENYEQHKGIFNEKMSNSTKDKKGISLSPVWQKKGDASAIH